MTAPEYAIVNLPDSMTFEQAGRFGYMGTSYGALNNAAAGPGQVALIDGITGTLGVAATVLGLAMGLSRILGTGRDEALLKRVKALAPDRIEVMQLGEGSTGEWAKSLTGGEGADFVISALGAKAPAATMLDSMKGVRRGGKVVNVGGVAEDLPIDVKWLMDEQVQIIGSNWFTTAQGQEMADMVSTGAIDLSYLEHRKFPLERVNEAISGLKDRDGGFSNYVVLP
jgi:alcohol dehydrogenase